MTSPLVVMVGADKGGVGKTTVCRALCDYMDERLLRAKAPRVLDSQFPEGDLATFRTTAEKINITDIRHQMRIFDDLSGVTIVDVAAGLLGYLMNALDQAGLLEDVKAGQLRLALLHVLGPTVTSMAEIAHATRVLGASASHFIVKNHITDTDFFEWDQQYAASLRALQNVTIEVPHLTARAADDVQVAKCSFLSYSRDRNRSRTLRGHVRQWLDKTWEGFDHVGLGALLQESSDDGDLQREAAQ